jgi:hypothetical protein
MSIKHVFVETNWVVDLVAPWISRNRGAGELLERGRRGELELHVPAISLSEAHKKIRNTDARVDLGSIRNFVRGRRDRGQIDKSFADATFVLLSQFQQHIKNEKAAAPDRIAALRQEVALDVFHLDEEMLVRSTLIAAETTLGLQSFDLAILAAVLVRGATLHAADHEVSFCTYDSDLQPWGDNNNQKDELRDLLDHAGVWVYGDFLLEQPARPPSWPSSK